MPQLLCSFSTFKEMLTSLYCLIRAIYCPNHFTHLAHLILTTVLESKSCSVGFFIF